MTPADMTTPRAGKPERVRCWVCGCVRRRRVYTLGQVVGQRRPCRVYGDCPMEGSWGRCGGTMHRASGDCRRVLRAALRHARGGDNRRSEYDS